MEGDNCSRELHPDGFDDAFGKAGKANTLFLGEKQQQHKTIASLITFCPHSRRGGQQIRQ